MKTTLNSKTMKKEELKYFVRNLDSACEDAYEGKVVELCDTCGLGDNFLVVTISPELDLSLKLVDEDEKDVTTEFSSELEEIKKYLSGYMLDKDDLDEMEQYKGMTLYQIEKEWVG